MDDASLGQVYTPPVLATTICQWAIRPRNGRPPKVLDPATGPGVFVRSATDRLADLGIDRPLDHVTAVDVDGTALAELQSAIDEEDGELRTRHGSFLGYSPSDLGQFDAVVGNPPFLRQEALDSDHYRAHLGAFGPPDSAPFRTGPQAISGRSDAYVYFVTQATRFLTEGGRLGYVVPAKWLQTRYGTSLQRFLYDHYRVVAIVGFEARAFPEALVDTVLLFCERRTRARGRQATTTQFIQVQDRLQPEALLATVSRHDTDSIDDPIVRDHGSHRLVGVRQRHLETHRLGNLSVYLRTPAELVEVLDHPALVPLGELGEVHRGVMTGANDFFLLEAGSDTAQDIDNRFLQPAIRSIRDVEGPLVRSPPAHYLFDVHGFVEAVRERSGPTAPLEQEVKAAMQSEGYDGALAHVSTGERQQYDQRSTCATREVWFDLGELSGPPILHPKFFDERVVIVHNPDSLVPTNAVDCVSLAADVPVLPTLGIMNTTLYAAQLESVGRAEGGGALQLMTYEVEEVPVLDPRSLSSGARSELASATRDLLSGEDGAGRRLDRLVLDALSLPFDTDHLRTLRQRMVTGRTERADADLLMDTGRR